MNKHKFILIAYLTIVFTYQLNHIEDKTRDVDEFASILHGSGFATDINSLNNTSFDQLYFFKNDNLSGVYNSTLLEEGGNCILFTSALHYWMLATGKSVATTRLFSLVFYLGSIVLIYMLSNILFDDKKIALSSSVLFGINPLIMHYGINTRCYIMATFFTLLSTYLFVVWRNQLAKQEAGRKITKKAAVYALCASASILIHYFSFFVIIIHFIFLLPSIVRHKKKYLIPSSFAYITIAFITGSWLIGGGIKGYQTMKVVNSFHQTYAHIKNKTLTFIQPTSTKNTLQFGLDTYSTWSYNYQYWRYFNEGGRMRYVVLLLCIPLIFLSGVILDAFKGNMRQNKNLLLVMLCLIFPLTAICMAYSSGHTVAYFLKYGIMAIPYFTILLSYGFFVLFNRSKNRISKTAIISLGLIFFCNAIVLKFSPIATFNSMSKDRLELVQMNTKTQKNLSAIHDPKKTIIEFGTPWMALIFNFHLEPHDVEFRQIINPALQPNEIYISNGTQHKPLYIFPKGYNGNESRFYK